MPKKMREMFLAPEGQKTSYLAKECWRVLSVTGIIAMAYSLDADMLYCAPGRLFVLLGHAAGGDRSRGRHLLRLLRRCWCNG